MMCLIKRNIDCDIYSSEYVSNNFVDDDFNYVEKQDLNHVLKIAFFLIVYYIFMFKLIFKLF